MFFIMKSLTKKFFSSISNNINIILAIFSFSILSILIVYCLTASPIADVWYYFNRYHLARDHGIVQGFFIYIKDSFEHTGRFFQWIIIFFGFLLFKINAIKIIPILLLITLFVSISWLLYQLKLFKNNKLSIFSVSCILTISSILMLPSSFDSLLWLDASVSYLGSLACFILIINFIFLMIHKKIPLHYQIAIFLFVILSQSLIETVSIYIIAWLFLISSFLFITKRKKHLLTLLKFLISSIIGFLLVYFSYGSIKRRETSPELNLKWIFFDSFSSFSRMILEWKYILLFIPIIVLAGFILTNTKKINLSSKQLLLIALSIFMSATYPVFILNNIVQDYVPHRIMSLPIFATVISSFIIGISLQKSKLLKFKNNYKIFSVLLIIIVIISTPYIINNMRLRIEQTSLREHLLKVRDIDIKKQKNNGLDTYIIRELPNNLISNAEDMIYSPNSNKLHWTVTSYLEFNGINSNLDVNKIRVLKGNYDF